MQFFVSRTFPVRRADGFAYMMDPATWSDWNPIGVPEGTEVVFARKGDTLPYVYRPTPLPISGTLHLEDVQDGASAEMRFEQPILGDVRMRWQFENAGNHAFTLTVTFDLEEVSGVRTALQRVSTAFLRRDLSKAFDTLQARFHTHTQVPEHVT